jgi:hypothetical protein
VGRSAATGVGLLWRSVRESGSSCSERERDEEEDAEAVAEEEQRMVPAGRGLGLRWLRLRRGGERKRKAEAEAAVGGTMAEEEAGEMDMAGWLAGVARFRQYSLDWTPLLRRARGEASLFHLHRRAGAARGGQPVEKRRRGSVRERKGGGTHLSAHDAVVLPAKPRRAEPRGVVALTGFLGVEILCR